MHRVFFLPVKAFPPAPNGPGTGGGRCHATYLCGERFNSRPPRGERQFDVDDESYKAIFQSTPSARRATLRPHVHPVPKNYFNPRPPRGGRRARRGTWQRQKQISIHALREEGDGCAARVTDRQLNFNPRPPRGGRRLRCSCHRSSAEFQSTPSARRATATM